MKHLTLFAKILSNRNLKWLVVNYQGLHDNKSLVRSFEQWLLAGFLMFVFWFALSFSATQPNTKSFIPRWLLFSLVQLACFSILTINVVAFVKTSAFLAFTRDVFNLMRIMGVRDIKQLSSHTLLDGWTSVQSIEKEFHRRLVDVADSMLIEQGALTDNITKGVAADDDSCDVIRTGFHSISNQHERFVCGFKAGRSFGLCHIKASGFIKTALLATSNTKVSGDTEPVAGTDNGGGSSDGGGLEEVCAQERVRP